MKIVLKLSEALQRCNDWLVFCNEKGWSEYVVSEGGGDIEVHLTEDEAKRFGII